MTRELGSHILYKDKKGVSGWRESGNQNGSRCYHIRTPAVLPPVKISQWSQKNTQKLVCVQDAGQHKSPDILSSFYSLKLCNSRRQHSPIRKTARVRVSR